jgi:hypothetical protein
MSSEHIKACVKKVCTTAYTRRQKKHGVSEKLAKEGCRITYCNPKCINTSFSTSLKMSKTLRKSPLYKRGEKWRAQFEKKRKKLFGTRKNILNNGFYVQIPKKEVALSRMRGEISGCYDTAT